MPRKFVDAPLESEFLSNITKAAAGGTFGEGRASINPFLRRLSPCSEGNVAEKGRRSSRGKGEEEGGSGGGAGKDVKG